MDALNANSIPRNRAIMKMIKELYPSFETLRVHESSPDFGTLQWLGSKIKDYTYSFFYEDNELGSDLRGGGGQIET